MELLAWAITSLWFVVLVVRLFTSHASWRMDLFTAMCWLVASAVLAVLYPAGRARRALVKGDFLGVTHPMSLCMGLARVRKLVALFVFCACFPVPTPAYLQSRVGIGDRGGGRGGVLPAVVRCAVCAGFVVSRQSFADG